MTDKRSQTITTKPVWKQPRPTGTKKDPLQEYLPDSPRNAWLDLALGMNNGRRRFVFKFKDDKQAIKFDEMTESVTRRRIRVSREKNIVTVIYKK